MEKPIHPNPPPDKDFLVQQDYYTETAPLYDQMHRDEHDLALAFLTGCIPLLGFNSMLDIGSATGLNLKKIKDRLPNLKICGIEPNARLRQIGAQRHGFTASELVEGNVCHLNFADRSFDVVSAIGVLHHVRDTAQATGEMLRVAGKAIFISDGNCFGQGPFWARKIKRLLDRSGLWPAFQFLKTRGRMYIVTPGDGLFYSYSVFKDLPLIRKQTRIIHFLNTQGTAIDLYAEAAHVALLALKR